MLFNRVNGKCQSILTLLISLFISTPVFALLESDINNDGMVDFCDFAKLASQWLMEDSNGLLGAQPVNMLNGTLTRNSVAFLDGKQYVANSPRKKIMAVSSPSYFELVTSIDVNGVGAITPIVHCLSDGYLWATTTEYTGLYKSSDGINWTQVQSSDDLTGVAIIHPHSSGAIFAVKGAAGSYGLYKSNDGTDLINSDMPEPKIIFDNGPNDLHCSCLYFNFHEAKDGVICLGEYQGAGGCRRVWQSIDGGDSFNPVYYEPDPNIKHSHIISKQEATGRWVIVWGDGGNFNKVSKSDDNGATWSDLETNTDYHFQPVEFYEYGDATRLLYGSDVFNSFGFYDVTTKQIEPLYWDGPNVSEKFCWAIIQYEDIFYASILQDYMISEADRRASIVISNDLKHWDVYHQFTTEYGIYRYLGVLNNKMQCIVQKSDGLLTYGRFAPAKITMYNSLCIDPATTNILSENESTMETDASGWTASGTVNSFTTKSLHGSKCVQLNSSITADFFYMANAKAVTDGQLYSGRVAMKSYETNQGGRVYWLMNDDGGGRYEVPQYFGLGRDQWQDIPLNPLTIEPADTSADIFIRPHHEGGMPIPNPTNLLLDCVQMELGPPTRWQIGGVPRAHETLTKAYTFPARWTEYIIWSPTTRLDYYLSGWDNQYIKSWYKDVSNYLELYYDPSDSKFKLQATIGGEAQTVLATTNTYKCYTNATVRLVVRYDGQFKLSVNYAGSWEHLAGIDGFSGLVGSKTGNYAEDQVISGSYLSDLLYDYVMSDKECL